MYKVIDLGCSVPETGEPRARLLTSDMVKTASSGQEGESAIQRFWNTLTLNGESAYLWVIGVSAMEWYGCNNNGDAFHEADLKNTYNDFVTNAHIFLHHVNKDPAKSIGKPIFAWYNEPMHRVELVLEIKRAANGAQAIIERLKSGEQMYVSMGCKVAHDVCSICGNRAKVRSEYCDHLKYNMKKILPDGRQVYAINPAPKFFDISMVTRPADPTAFALDKIASCGGSSEDPLFGYDFDMEALAESMHKTAALLKQVNGEIVDKKLGAQISALDDLERAGLENVGWPQVDYGTVERLGVSPMGLLKVLSSMAAPLSIMDAFWMSGLPRFMPPAPAFSLLPGLMDSLASDIPLLGDVVRKFVGSYGGELESSPVRRTLVIKIMTPVVRKRLDFTDSLKGIPAGEKVETEAFSEKTAALLPQRGSMIWPGHRSMSAWPSNFAPVKVRDAHGNVGITNGISLSQSAPFELGTARLPGAYDSFGRLKPGYLRVLGSLLSTFAGIVGMASNRGAVAKATVLEGGNTVVEGVRYGEIPVSTLMDTDMRIVKTAHLQESCLCMGIPAAVMLDYKIGCNIFK